MNKIVKTSICSAVALACVVFSFLAGCCWTINSASFEGWSNESEYVISYYNGARYDTYFEEPRKV